MKVLGIIGAVLAGFVLLVFLMTDTAEIGLQTDAEYAVKARLVDPSSAEFAKPPPFLNKEKRIVCGIVNAKNRMGGYAGRAPYIYDNGVVILYQTDADVRALGHNLREKCGVFGHALAPGSNTPAGVIPIR